MLCGNPRQVQPGVKTVRAPDTGSDGTKEKVKDTTLGGQASEQDSSETTIRRPNHETPQSFIRGGIINGPWGECSL